jgi:hypothetical protein
MKPGYYQSNKTFYCYPVANVNDPAQPHDVIVQNGNIPTRLSMADFNDEYMLFGMTPAEVTENQNTANTALASARAAELV